MRRRHDDDVGAVLANVWPRVKLAAPARAEQLWRGSSVEVVVDVCGVGGTTSSETATRLAVQVRKEDLGGLGASSHIIGTTPARRAAADSEQVTSVVALEHRSQDFSASLLRTPDGAAKLVHAGPPYRKSYYRAVYATRRRWSSSAAGSSSAARASAEHLLDKRHADDVLLRELLGVPDSWDPLSVVELIRGVALSFVLDHYVSLELADQRDGLVAQCLHASKFAPPLP